MASREKERKVFMDDMMYGLMFAGAITAGSVLAVVIFYVLVAVAQWRIFTKAGEAGWKGIIPLYNLYIQYKLTWDTKMFWYLIAVNLASSVLSFIASGFLIAIVTFILSPKPLGMGLGLRSVWCSCNPSSCSSWASAAPSIWETSAGPTRHGFERKNNVVIWQKRSARLDRRALLGYTMKWLGYRYLRGL